MTPTEILNELDKLITSLNKILLGDSSDTISMGGVTKPSVTKHLHDALAAYFGATGLADAKLYVTKAEMTASSDANGTFAVVYNDTTVADNGYYRKASGVWTKTKWDPATNAFDMFKGYADENRTDARTINLTGDRVLTEEEANFDAIYFTGTLASTATVTFPKTRSMNALLNMTGGGQSLRIITQDQIETPVTTIPPSGRILAFNTTAAMRQLYGHKLDATGGHAKDVTADTLAWTDTSQKLANAAFVHNVAKNRAGHYTVNVEGVTAPFTIPIEALNYSTIIFSGALTADIKVTMPSTNAVWTFINNTTGGKTVIVTNTADTSPIELFTGQTAQVNQSGAYLRYIGLPSRNGTLRGAYEAESPPTVDNSNRVATSAHVNAKIDYKDGIRGITLTDAYLSIAPADMDKAILLLNGNLSQVSEVTLGSSAKFHFIVNNTNRVLNIKGPQQSTTFELKIGERVIVQCSGGYVHLYSAKPRTGESLGPATADSPPTVDNSNRVATSAHVKAWTSYLDSIRTVTLTDGKTTLTPSELERENVVFVGELPGPVVLKAQESIVGKRYFRNGTNVKINVLGSGQSGKGLELPVGAVAYALMNGTFISTISNTADQGSSGGGTTTLPIASASVLGGIKVGTGLSISPDGKLSASRQSAVTFNNVGKFKCGSDYLAGQIVEHGSGIYEVKNDVVGAETPFNNVNFNKISHNNYAGPLRSLKTISTQITNVASTNLVPYFMTKDGMTTMGKEGRYQNVSYDYGETWLPSTLFDFGTRTGVRWIKQTNDGELLVCTYTTADDAPTTNKVWKSTGWKSFYSVQPTWEVVFQFQKKGVNLSDWGFSQHNNIVIMTEYGYKNGFDDVSDPETYARYVYMSKDYGKTWETIFDLGSVTNGTGVHMHGACFDPYWSRIWVSHGDGSFGGNGLFYSDDFGKTWQSGTQFHNPNMSNFSQSVHIVALPTCILLASDSYPNGIQRIDRAQGKVPIKGYYTIEAAYMIPDQANRLNHLFHHTAKAEWLPDSPWLFVWGCETQAGKAGCVATFDGWAFHEVWVSENNFPIGYGGRTVMGVTPENEIIIGVNDPTNETPWYEVRCKVAID